MRTWAGTTLLQRERERERESHKRYIIVDKTLNNRLCRSVSNSNASAKSTIYQAVSAQCPFPSPALLIHHSLRPPPTNTFPSLHTQPQRINRCLRTGKKRAELGFEPRTSCMCLEERTQSRHPTTRLHGLFTEVWHLLVLIIYNICRTRGIESGEGRRGRGIDADVDGDALRVVA
ncbi:hypothetical protein K458DRAFT_39598 [Lentithecium fluviatile CBS 122367]|uniref:Uncharacterized protein n=1 Tax=Lentithecium fluviatile CBS 122367 TaxID=1168545 RepID=A0A6G1IZ79_9PLEO|nr:hypothetical protein K458DRAFT_39598 [Lentithecium fluviatile CBS 122367]